MKRVCYFTSPLKISSLREAFTPQNWSRGVCFTEDKDAARLLASQNDKYIYKCTIDTSLVEAVKADTACGSTWKAVVASIKNAGCPVVKLVENFTCLPEINLPMECIQYLVFNPDIATLVQSSTIKKSLRESLVIHSELNPNLFNEMNYMVPAVRERLIEIGTKFTSDLKDQGIPIEVEDYWLVGSNAAYNYQPDSDLDLHIIAKPLREQIDSGLLRLLYDYAKSVIMKNYEITIKGQPVEIYIEDGGSSAVSNGVYSLIKDEWIKVPKPEEDRVLYPELTEEYKELLQDYYSLADEDIPEFIDRLYLMRKESLAREGEFGLGNLMFKEFRNSGRLQTLKDRMYKAESEKLTLESLNEELSSEEEDEIELFLKNISGGQRQVTLTQLRTRSKDNSSRVSIVINQLSNQQLLYYCKKLGYKLIMK